MIRQTVQVRPEGRDLQIPAVLRYDPADPLAIEMELDTDYGLITWMFARDLLAEALRTGTAGIGDVGLTAQGGQLAMRLSSPDGEAVLWLGTDLARRFLQRTYRAIPRAREAVDVDALLSDLLAD